MTQTNDTKTVIVERELPHAAEKIWRALTQAPLIEEWLMKNDFSPVVGHRFDLRADWGVVDCQVLAVEPNQTLSYTWSQECRNLDSHPYEHRDQPAHGAVGLPPDHPQYYQGAKAGWQQFFSALEQVLARIT